MCNFKSAIVSRSGVVYHHPLVDGHNDLIDLFGLHDEISPQFTPVEFLPGNDMLDLDKYSFIFDKKQPSWADDDWIELATTKLRNIVKTMIVDKDTKILVGGTYLIAPNIKVGKVIGGRIKLAKEANLYGANLHGTDLYGADLSGANLSGADLYKANLSGANLSGANLYGTNLSEANLYGADLSGANLYKADLSGADLSGANRYDNPPNGWEIENGIFVKSGV